MIVVENSVIVITNKTFTEICDNQSLKLLRDKNCKMVLWDIIIVCKN